MSDPVDPMDWSPPGPSVHGILQARILEWGCHALLQETFLQGTFLQGTVLTQGSIRGPS